MIQETSRQTTNLSAGTGDVVPLPDQHRRIALVAVAEGAEIAQWPSELDTFSLQGHRFVLRFFTT